MEKKCPPAFAVPGAALVYIPGEPQVAHVRARAPFDEETLKNFRDIITDALRSLCAVGDRLVPAYTYAADPGYPWRMLGWFLRDCWWPVGPDFFRAETETLFGLDSVNGGVWYALPFLQHGFEGDFEELDAAEFDSGRFRELVEKRVGAEGCDVYPLLLHRGYLPSVLDSILSGCIAGFAEKKELKSVPPPVPKEVYMAGFWPEKMPLPPGEPQIPERILELSRGAMKDVSLVKKLQKAGWKVVERGDGGVDSPPGLPEGGRRGRNAEA